MYSHFFLAEFLLTIGLLGLLLFKCVSRKYLPQIKSYMMMLYLAAFSAVGWTIMHSSGPAFRDGLFVVDQLSMMVKLLVLGFGVITIIFFDQPMQKHKLPSVETYFLIGIQTVGMMITGCCENWISLFVSLELMYLPTYALIGLQTQDRYAQEAACKYIIMGAFSTGLLLYGISLIYAVIGSFDLKAMMLANPLTTLSSNQQWLSLDGDQTLFMVGNLLILVALCFKIGVVPFHLWVRDVYEGGIYAAVSLIASAPKLVLLLVWSRVFIDTEVMAFSYLSWLTFAIGILSMFVGHYLALVQERIRTLLAYSSLAHMGFVLLALGLVSQSGHEAAMVYTIGYAVTIATVFLALSGMVVNSRGVLLVEDLKGLAKVHPRVALLLLLAIFSLLGLPPFAGFMLKVRVLTALLAGQQTVIAVLTLLPTVVAACYYINMIHLMYFQAQDDAIEVECNYSALQKAVLITGGGLIISVGIYPSYVFNWVTSYYFA